MKDRDIPKRAWIAGKIISTLLILQAVYIIYMIVIGIIHHASEFGISDSPQDRTFYLFNAIMIFSLMIGFMLFWLYIGYETWKGLSANLLRAVLLVILFQLFIVGQWLITNLTGFELGIDPYSSAITLIAYIFGGLVYWWLWKISKHLLGFSSDTRFKNRPIWIKNYFAFMAVFTFRAVYQIPVANLTEFWSSVLGLVLAFTVYKTGVRLCIGKSNCPSPAVANSK